MDHPSWNNHPNQMIFTNLESYLELFDGDGGAAHRVLGNTKKQFYSTREVFKILCRWYHKPVLYDDTYGWTGDETSIGRAFPWPAISLQLGIALCNTGDIGFSPYTKGPYSAYNVFRILYRLKYGEWLLDKEALIYRRCISPIIEHQCSTSGSPIDGKEPTAPKKVHDGSALFSAIGKIGMPYECQEMQENRGRK